LVRTDPQRLRDDPAGVTEALMAAYTDAVASPRQRVG
jgi:hypothetical protein